MYPNSRFCTFSLQDSLFGVEVEKVQEVLRRQPITRVPLASPVVEGLINLRGQIVLALNLRRRLGLAERHKDEHSMNVIVRTGEGPLSLLVDAVGEVIETGQAEFETIPGNVPPPHKELLRGVYKLPDQLLLILNLERAIQT